MIMKKEIKLRKIDLKISKVNWQRGLYYSLLAITVLFIGLVTYIMFKPLDPELENIIKEEISSSNITFDQKTLDNLKKRLEPTPASQIPTSKNPFVGF
jgi:hypothetical protein